MNKFEIPTYLGNYQAVRTAFGGWPSFHDAPVLRFERTEIGIELVLHGWKMLSEVDDKGYFKLVDRHIVRFEFQGVRWPDEERYRTHADRHGNGLMFLGWSSPQEWEITREFKVVLDSYMGGELDTEFWAKAGRVTEVVPCDANGKPLV